MADNMICDFLVLGSGTAGLYAALQAAPYGRVIMVTSAALASGSSYRAQGGIAAVTSGEDSFTSHIEDTLTAGRGLCDRKGVDILVREGAAIVHELMAGGMHFDCGIDGQPCRGLEGGHSRHRILHAQGIQTGRALVDFLGEKIRNCPAIDIIEHGLAYQLCTDEHGHCSGAGVFLPDRAQNLAIHASATILATGGYAALFEHTTNPAGNTGIGLGLAHSIGARLADLEFVQFHPTALYSPEGNSFLISEALRGAGATLVDETGQRFLTDIPGAELAPRDVVAAAIHTQITRQSRPCVGLDLRHLDPCMLKNNFGAIMERVAEQGIDTRRQPIPVAPAAHYSIGGIAVDHDGATDVPCLYAAGEVAATGVHGANRLASNSLLECLVFARRAATHAANIPRAQSGKHPSIPPLSNDDAHTDIVAIRRQRLGRLLTRHVGIERNDTGLSTAQSAIDTALRDTGWQDGVPGYHAFHDRHVHQLAGMMIQAARRRPESIGVHCRTDSPVPFPPPRSADQPPGPAAVAYDATPEPP